MIALHISIYGRVQAVGFRNWIKESAEKRGLTGWVRNASDGSVEVFIQGEDEILNDLLALCWEGPDLADVEDVLTQDTNVDESIVSFNIH
tara:strand:- start:113 stop:382 length:270 start_codon:yes stop_codon:yes gene_type:complete